MWRNMRDSACQWALPPRSIRPACDSAQGWRLPIGSVGAVGRTLIVTRAGDPKAISMASAVSVGGQLHCDQFEGPQHRRQPRGFLQVTRAELARFGISHRAGSAAPTENGSRSMRSSPAEHDFSAPSHAPELNSSEIAWDVWRSPRPIRSSRRARDTYGPSPVMRHDYCNEFRGPSADFR